jgi:hypothetical protein
LAASSNEQAKQHNEFHTGLSISNHYKPSSGRVVANSEVDVICLTMAAEELTARRFFYPRSALGFLHLQGVNPQPMQTPRLRRSWVFEKAGDRCLLNSFQCRNPFRTRGTEAPFAFFPSSSVISSLCSVRSLLASSQASRGHCGSIATLQVPDATADPSLRSG